MTETKAELAIAVQARSRVGEGPVWHRGHLYWVDILEGRICVSDVETGETISVTVPTWVGAAIPMAGGGCVAATREGFATMRAGQLRTVLAFLPDGIRMNDAKCDPAGRLWAGSCAEDFAHGAGALHRLGPDWTCTTVLEGLSQPNGIGWSPDGTAFYLVDTQDRALYAFAFDIGSGDLGSRRTVVRFDEDEGYPDGLAVDADGNIWVAMWGGGQVLQLSPEGELLRRVEVPVAQPSSCAFIGDSLETLCVTSASEGLELTGGALDGSVFTIDGLDVVGTPVATFAGSAC